MHHSFRSLVILMLLSLVLSHVRPDFPGAISPELQELRKRWGAADIIRDLDHIKSDVQRISKLQDTGEISTNEALFYFLRMHDFDDNKKLDGHELMAAMGHALEHSSDSKMEFPEKEAVVDSFFAYDDDNDGMISYPELRKHLSPDEK
ncbi:multiple coagulation factor deficiency protein 2 homolog [Parasteatoda tepidariorum]|uniref:multiple coagulation factor deficiency protein 2 homolog n=1 Tax=Parasteatoda tepidariorum TaxID=114398 RepID=UPI00077F9830|nr:multiple coagulation factor deficiency protein 2 homolog [Parasteatoda tepidariorum]